MTPTVIILSLEDATERRCKPRDFDADRRQWKRLYQSISRIENITEKLDCFAFSRPQENTK